MKKPVCVKCGRPLTDPLSIAIGMGPDCRGSLSRRKWKFPTPRWRVQGGRTVLVEIKGKIEPPPIGDLSPSDRQLLKRMERMKSHDRNEYEDQDPTG